MCYGVAPGPERYRSALMAHQSILLTPSFITDSEGPRVKRPNILFTGAGFLGAGRDGNCGL